MPKRLSGDAKELDRVRAVRRDADLHATMSERLARVHTLSKQMSAIKGAAKTH
jgi:hypothetical protein